MNVKIPHMTVHKSVSIPGEVSDVNVLLATGKIVGENVMVCL